MMRWPWLRRLPWRSVTRSVLQSAAWQNFRATTKAVPKGRFMADVREERCCYNVELGAVMGSFEGGFVIFVQAECMGVSKAVHLRL